MKDLNSPQAKAMNLIRRTLAANPEYGSEFSVMGIEELSDKVMVIDLDNGYTIRLDVAVSKRDDANEEFARDNARRQATKAVDEAYNAWMEAVKVRQEAEFDKKVGVGLKPEVVETVYRNEGKAHAAWLDALKNRASL